MSYSEQKAGWEGEEAGRRVRHRGAGADEEEREGQQVSGGRRREERGRCSHWKEHRFNDILQQQSQTQTSPKFEIQITLLVFLFLFILLKKGITDT